MRQNACGYDCRVEEALGSPSAVGFEDLWDFLPSPNLSPQVLEDPVEVVALHGHPNTLGFLSQPNQDHDGLDPLVHPSLES